MRVIDDTGSSTGDLSEQLDAHLGEPYGAVPKGRKGLFRALATSVAPPSPARTLPSTDANRIGEIDSMFDYDPDLATALSAD